MKTHEVAGASNLRCLVSRVATLTPIMVASLLVGCGDAGVDVDVDVPNGGAELAEVDASASSVVLQRLSDGDSGWFFVDGEELEVRLLGYNAPERYENDGDSEVSCNGEIAEEALFELMERGGSLELIGSEVDRFGRTLADIELNGDSVVSMLIESGYGLALGEGPNRDLMREAAAQRRGMWGDQCGEPLASGLVVEAVEPDPPGRDEEDLNGEWVRLYNDSDDTIDLDGWDIRDDSSSNRFSLGGRIEPYSSLTVRTGSGQSNASDYFLGSNSPVWSNRTDSVLVMDPSGVIVTWTFIDG